MLYLLELKRTARRDEKDAMVVRAKDAKQARKIASANAMDEGSAAWLSAKTSWCYRLKETGAPELILSEYLSY